MILTPLDLVLSAVLILLIVRGTMLGFIAEFFSKAAVIAGTLCAVLFFRRVAPYTAAITGSDQFAGLTAFLFLFLSVYLIIKYIQHLAGSAFENESMNNLDRAMGFFLGIAEGIIVIVLILIVLRLQPWFDTGTLIADSLFASILEPFIPAQAFRIPVFSGG